MLSEAIISLTYQQFPYVFRMLTNVSVQIIISTYEYIIANKIFSLLNFCVNLFFLKLKYITTRRVVSYLLHFPP